MVSKRFKDTYNCILLKTFAKFYDTGNKCSTTDQMLPVQPVDYEGKGQTNTLNKYKCVYRYCYNKTDVCGLIEEFVDQNEEYVTSMVDMYGYDSYWHQVST